VAVGAAADPVRGEDKVIVIVAAVVVMVTPVLAQHTKPAAPARDGPRHERHQNDPRNAHLRSDSVHLTTQAWLLDCHPRD
jgi:hypothetical protein